MAVDPQLQDGLNGHQRCASAYVMGQGFAVFRLASNAKVPERGSHGHLDAVTEAAAAVDMFADDACNLGIATGVASDVFVIEVDRKEGGHTDGVASFRQVRADLGPLPQTYTTESPTGSRHFYFAMPDNVEVRNQVNWRPGIDVKGTGGYVVAPPSVTPKGAYRVIRPAPIASCPESWLADIAEPRRIAWLVDDGEPVPAGEQELAVANRAWRMVRQGWSEPEIAAALWAFIQARCPNVGGRMPWTEDEARQKAARAIKRCRAREADLADPPGELTPKRWRETAVRKQPKLVEPTGSLADALNGVRDALHTFVVMPDNVAVAATLWVANTWWFEHWSKCPYLLITSPQKGSGKSTLADLLQQLARNGEFSANLTPSVLFRMIEHADTAITMVIDEVDTVFGARSPSESQEAMRGILNSGHSSRTGFTHRADGHGQELKRFRTYCPKLLCGIGNRVPDTVMNRSIHVHMALATAAELKAVTLAHEHTMLAVTAPLATELEAHTTDVLAGLSFDVAIPGGITSARAQDNWRPLLALADYAGDHWPDTARDAATAIAMAQTAESSDGDDRRLVFDVHAIRRESTDERISLFDLVNMLCRIPDAPWSDYSGGKGLTTAQLGKLLRQYGVKSARYRVNGTTAWGYYWAAMDDMFTRYLGGES